MAQNPTGYSHSLQVVALCEQLGSLINNSKITACKEIALRDEPF